MALGATLRFPSYNSTSWNTDWLLIWQPSAVHACFSGFPVLPIEVFGDFRKSTIFSKWLKSWWNAPVKIQQKWYLNIFKLIAYSRLSPMISVSISIHFPNPFLPQKSDAFPSSVHLLFQNFSFMVSKIPSHLFFRCFFVCSYKVGPKSPVISRVK